MIDKIDPTQTYWFFRLEFAPKTGRCTRKIPIVEVNIKRSESRGYNWVIQDSETGSIVDVFAEFYIKSHLYDTKEEAELDWEATINNQVDYLQSRHEAALKNLDKHRLRKK